MENLQAMLEQEQIGRPDHEQHRKTAEQQVADFLEAAQALEFLHREQFDIADVAVFVQQAVVAVVIVMAFSPVAVRHETQ